MNPDFCVQLDNAAYTYEEAPSPAISGATVSVRPGEFVAVLGHNGSGKSTMAKLLNALFLPTEGRVVVCGFDTKEEKVGNNSLTVNLPEKRTSVVIEYRGK